MKIALYTDKKELIGSNISKIVPSGGGDVQLLKTKEYLEKKGLNADILGDNSDLKKYTFVHIFGFGAPKAERILALHSQGIKVVLSPIFWYDEDLEKIRYKTPLQNFHYAFRNSSIGKILVNNRRIKTFKEMAEALKIVDILIVSSELERKHLEEVFHISLPNVQIVSNGVDKSFSSAAASEFTREYGIKDFVLSVGRIDDQKNRLSLVKAMKKTKLQLVIVGNYPESRRYKKAFEQIKKESSSNTLFIPAVPHEKLKSVYAAAKVHALPSLFEISPLVCMEAGLAGCNLVMSERGGSKEYFKNFAWYCDPLNTESIRNAIEEAYNTPYNNELRKHLLNNFTWEKCMEQLISVYRNIS